MTLIQAIELAREQGYDIEYRKRKDGGVRVTKVNGVKYTASKGNEAVRKITGKAKISVRLSEALKNNRSETKAKLLGKRLNKKFKKAQKLYEKITGKKVKHKKLKETIKKHGRKSVKGVMERMHKAVKHKLDFTYTGEVASFVAVLRDAADTPNSVGDTYDFSHLIAYIEANYEYVSERALQACIAIYYDWNTGKTDGDIAEQEMTVEIAQDIEKLKEIERQLG